MAYDPYIHVSADGRRYCIKGEYREHMRRTYGDVPGLREGESWDDWFEVYFATLLETGEARRVGNHYEVYDGVTGGDGVGD